MAINFHSSLTLIQASSTPAKVTLYATLSSYTICNARTISEESDSSGMYRLLITMTSARVG